MAALAQTAQGVCGISTLGVIQKLSEHGPGQQGLGGPAWAGVWTRLPPEVASNLNNSVSLRFCSFHIIHMASWQKVQKAACMPCEEMFFWWMVARTRITFLLPLFYLLLLALWGIFSCPWNLTKADWKRVWRCISHCHARNQWLSRNWCRSDQLCMFTIVGQFPLFHVPHILFSSMMTAFSFHLVMSSVYLSLKSWNTSIDQI